MKLMFCKECQDLVKLDFKVRFCKCGEVLGKCKDEENVVVTKKAVVIDIDNLSLEEVLKKGKGEIRASMIAKNASGVVRCRERDISWMRS